MLMRFVVRFVRVRGCELGGRHFAGTLKMLVEMVIDRFLRPRMVVSERCRPGVDPDLVERVWMRCLGSGRVVGGHQKHGDCRQKANRPNGTVQRRLPPASQHWGLSLPAN